MWYALSFARALRLFFVQVGNCWQDMLGGGESDSCRRRRLSRVKASVSLSQSDGESARLRLDMERRGSRVAGIRVAGIRIAGVE
jgi:hypothetical protein